MHHHTLLLTGAGELSPGLPVSKALCQLILLSVLIWLICIIPPALNRSGEFASRPGVCPTAEPESSSPLCSLDTDCSGLLKCCSWSGARRCVAPAPTGRAASGQGPAAVWALRPQVGLHRGGSQDNSDPGKGAGGLAATVPWSRAGGLLSPWLVPRASRELNEWESSREGQSCGPLSGWATVSGLLGSVSPEETQAWLFCTHLTAQSSSWWSGTCAHTSGMFSLPRSCTMDNVGSMFIT